ncbi:chromosome partitioning protein [Sphaerisporangium siamense]|uniref:non-specific protein-tyrosine kinase n=1 Tax=Sphaerisporangium siamense TaxID=795645 RepID=A0A7W7DAG9_9ACTN|nr:polysaccharide biosynthesis tyrosine autokinase [Sphaerisporangium siamense]MBB4702979.1 non-specific protein-tyrosine kinase [Sphaerisporangium siamense]GII83261.1 chromosome partitioning protein [Sphaerisporangium siamense]
MQGLYYLRLIRAHWALIALALIASAAAAMVVTAKTPPRYQAQIDMLVTGYDKEGSLATAIQAGALSQQRVQSYASLVSSRRVVGQIAGPDEVGRVQAGIKAEAIPMTTLIRVTVTDSDPVRAARLADKLGVVFPQVIDKLERPSRSSPSTVRVTVVDQASVPVRPVSPRPLVNLLVAELIALAAVIGALVLRDRVDTTIKTPETLQAVSKSPTIGVIGRERDAQRHPLIIRDRGVSSRAEAFRAMRTNLQFISVDRRPRSLVVTSCLAGEGKTSIAVNLAIVLAQADWRVVIVDADLRRPRVAAQFGLEGSAGLTDVLIGSASLEDVAQTWGPPSLTVLTSGRIPPNPSELLNSQGMRKLLATLTDTYDIVIIDTPPLLPVTDAASLAAVCDSTLLIARHGRTRMGHIARATELLSSINARVVGSVLNLVPAKTKDTYGYDGSYQPEEVPRPPAEAGAATAVSVSSGADSPSAIRRAADL